MPTIYVARARLSSSNTLRIETRLVLPFDQLDQARLVLKYQLSVYQQKLVQDKHTEDRD